MFLISGWVSGDIVTARISIHIWLIIYSYDSPFKRNFVIKCKCQIKRLTSFMLKDVFHGFKSVKMYIYILIGKGKTSRKGLMYLSYWKKKMESTEFEI